jgi:hypothetical protein
VTEERVFAQLRERVWSAPVTVTRSVRLAGHYSYGRLTLLSDGASANDCSADGSRVS